MMGKDLIEKSIMEKEGLEKKSRGPIFLSNAYGNVQSRYLKAPMGSCHDLCKYGHKHDFDDEGKHTIFRRFMKNGNVSDSVQNHAGDLNMGDRRKISRGSDKAKVLQQNMQKVVGMTEIPNEISLQKKSMAIPLQTISSSVEVDHLKNLNANEKKKKKQAVKPKASPVLEHSPVKQNKLKASAEITSGGDPNIFEEKVASYVKETITSSAWKVNRQKNMTGRKRSASTKLQSERKNVYLPSKKIDGSAKPAISLKAKVPLVRSVAQLNATRNLESSRNLDRKVSKSFKMLKVGDRNFRKLQTASIYSTIPVHDVVSLKERKFKNLEHATHLRGKKTDDGADIHRNIKKSIEAKSKNEGMVANDENFSIEGDGYISESCVSELSEIEDVKSKQGGDHSKEKDKRRVRRTPAAKIDDSSSLPYKMKFKRGRVIDLRPTENVGPRRLRFRRGRVLDENSNGEVIKRFFRKRDKSDMKPSGAIALANSSEAATVILKHQDAQEKKDMQALFNHVIEETASKLVKTRKSKVKALVGAFETVISLQETKAARLI
ncbi:uncharacterized protein LOC110096751 [Dendrobium catenatum]|uniref:Calmodulin-binding domain-containing protein n=1 Tax=Dendrobium catenatum TaxID=906689 RepID=A0A2I0W8T3_9ASPA|nr:uncharacterized protein LOC110096751 [Dendrobium catenatum]PKU72061.1 hypothetical protein MA16_Dca014661 [Dendrobium catenatum]